MTEKEINQKLANAAEVLELRQKQAESKAWQQLFNSSYFTRGEKKGEEK